jgi:membrane-associated phospholipid phosphatase
MNNLAQLGGPLLSVLLLAALSIISAARGRWLAAGLLVGLFLAMAAVEASLRLRLTAVAWQNPTGLFAHPRGHYVIDSSYPSGHMARFLFLALITAQLLPARWRSIGVLLALAGGVFVAGQRVVSLAHTGSDVVGGWLLGAGAAVVYAAVAPRLHKLEQWGRRRERYFP